MKVRGTRAASPTASPAAINGFIRGVRGVTEHRVNASQEGSPRIRNRAEYFF